VSHDDAILYAAQYYIRFLALSSDVESAADDDKDVICDVDDDCKRYVRLRKLLSFPSLQKSCNGDINDLR